MNSSIYSKGRATASPLFYLKNFDGNYEVYCDIKTVLLPHVITNELWPNVPIIGKYKLVFLSGIQQPNIIVNRIFIK